MRMSPGKPAPRSCRSCTHKNARIAELEAKLSEYEDITRHWPRRVRVWNEAVAAERKRITEAVNDLETIVLTRGPETAMWVREREVKAIINTEDTDG